MRGLRFGAVLLAALAWISAAQAQEKRVALVIGNAAYKEAPLKNPVSDARLVAAKLKELGFDVTARENATREQMAGAIRAFSAKLSSGSVALVYYAGHGVQSRGRNYLIPVDASLKAESDLRYEAVELTGLMEDVEQAQTRVNIVVLDACRNNPFERRMRGAARGLAAVDAARGSLIAYATAPGSVAADGDGANAPYTEELVKALAVPNLKAEEVFKRVTAAVEDRTKGAQTPWISSSLRGDFIFNLTVNIPPSASNDREVIFWQSAERGNRIEEYEAYLQRFPTGEFAPLARARISALKPPTPTSAALPGAPKTSGVASTPPFLIPQPELVTPSSAAPRLPSSSEFDGVLTCWGGDRPIRAKQSEGKLFFEIDNKTYVPKVTAGPVDAKLGSAIMSMIGTTTTVDVEIQQDEIRIRHRSGGFPCNGMLTRISTGAGSLSSASATTHQSSTKASTDPMDTATQQHAANAQRPATALGAAVQSPDAESNPTAGSKPNHSKVAAHRVPADREFSGTLICSGDTWRVTARLADNRLQFSIPLGRRSDLVPLNMPDVSSGSGILNLELQPHNRAYNTYPGTADLTVAPTSITVRHRSGGYPCNGSVNLVSATSPDPHQ